MAADLDSVVSGSSDQSLQVWDLKSAQPKGKRLYIESPVTCVAISGEILACGDKAGDIRLWNIETLQPIKPPTPSVWTLDLKVQSHSRDIDNDQSDEHNDVYRVEIEKHHFGAHGFKAERAVCAIAVIGDFISYAADDDSKIWEWNWKTGLPSGFPIVPRYGSISCLAMTQEATVFGHRRGAEVWYRRSNSVLRVAELLPGSESGVTAIAISGSLVAAGGPEGIVWLWDLWSRRLLRKIRVGVSINCLALEGSSILVGARGGLFRIDILV
jgi:WD40 repeat protein